MEKVWSKKTQLEVGDWFEQLFYVMIIQKRTNGFISQTVKATDNPMSYLERLKRKKVGFIGWMLKAPPLILWIYIFSVL